MAYRTKVVDKDRGWDKIRRHASDMAHGRPGGCVKVGIIGNLASTLHGDEAARNALLKTGRDIGGRFLSKAQRARLKIAKPSTLTNADIAEIQEFGSLDGKIPERSFIRATIDMHAQEYSELGKKLGGAVLGGRMTREHALELLGQKVVADMVRRINEGIPPENADSTKAHKGSSKPLIDTGQLKASLTYETVK